MEEERMQERSKLVSRRWRTAAILAAGIAVGAVLFATPAASHIGSVAHLWNEHIKPKADARYLQNTKTVVDSAAVNAGSFNSLQVDCPAGFQAIGGGVDSNDIDSQFVTSSGPVINGNRILSVANGQHGAATGWWGATFNSTGGALVMKVAVICAK
jgi:hypothetical protein